MLELAGVATPVCLTARPESGVAQRPRHRVAPRRPQLDALSSSKLHGPSPTNDSSRRGIRQPSSGLRPSRPLAWQEMTDFREAVTVRSGDQRTDLLKRQHPEARPEERSAQHRPWFDGRRLTSVRETISDDARTRRRYPGRSGFRSEPLLPGASRRRRGWRKGRECTKSGKSGSLNWISPRVRQEGRTEAGQRSGGPR